MNDTTAQPGYCYEQAKGMAAMGYKLVPIGVGKKYPPIQKWQDEATDDDKTITGWFKSQRNGLGWAMGLQPNGQYLIAIDIDGEEGGSEFIRLVTEHPESVDAFKRTVQQVTGSNGAHYVFSTPYEIRNSAKQFAPNIDIRGEGGQILWGPTIHPNGKPYQNVKNPIETEIVPAPEWVLERLEEMSRSEPVTAPSVLHVAQLVRDVPHETSDLPSEHANRNLSIPRMLSEMGWTYRETRGGTQQFWVHPNSKGKEGGAVYHEDTNVLNVWTTSAPEFNVPGLTLVNNDGSIYCKPLDVYAVRHRLRTFEEAVKHYGRNEMPASPAPAGVSAGLVPQEASPMQEGTLGLNLPDEFWESRDWLAHIRQAAHNRQMSADSILGAIITRYAAAIPPQYRIPAIIMAESTFDHISVLVAESSGGKSAAMSVARELFPGPQQRKDIVWDFPTPSGEGLVGAFFEMVQEDDGGKKVMVNKKTKTAVHFSVDEALGLVEASGRQGATIGSVLCTAWSGGNPGQGNASAERKRVGMNPWTYRMSGLAAIQSSLGYRLMEDTFVEQGLSGRLVFFAAEDPTIPHWTVRPEWPGALDFPIHPTVDTTISYDRAIEEEILEQNHLKQTKKVRIAPIDGHLNLVKLKLSGVLALMDGRKTVTPSDWELAGMVVDSHLALRNSMLAIKKQATYERSVTAATAQAHFEATKDEVKERQAVSSLRDTIIRHVPEEGITRSPLRKATVSSKTKHRFDMALTKAIEDGKLVERDGRYFRA